MLENEVFLYQWPLTLSAQSTTTIAEEFFVTAVR